MDQSIILPFFSIMDQIFPDFFTDTLDDLKTSLIQERWPKRSAVE